MEFYLSELLGKSIVNKSKEKIGHLEDVVMTDIGKAHPKVRGLVIKRGLTKEAVFVPSHDLETFSPKIIKLATDVVDLTPFARHEAEVLLVKDVYDKQIVDIDDRRLTRVNDLLLENEKTLIRLKGVDVSVLGLMKRLKIPQILHILKRNIVDWEDVQFLGGNTPVKFKVQFKNLESLHPVDIGRIIFEGPGYKQGSKVLAALKDPIAADIIEELSPKLQKNLIESMKVEDVADVIKHMPADKAADLLLSLGQDYLKKILPHLEASEAQKIQDLLSYPEHTTGAHMTTDYLAISADTSVDQALEILREEEPPDFTTYIYILENKFSNKLQGVISTHDFLLASKRDRISSIINTKLVLAFPHDPLSKSVKKLYRYNLSALPVVNNKTDKKLIGIITFRNAISFYIPKRWKSRIRHLFSPNS